MLRSKQQVLSHLGSPHQQVADARGPGRFAGAEAEPRAGIMPGHIPGARNVPYASLFNPDGTYKAPAAIRSIFAGAGIDLEQPVVTSCGSGMTACVLAFAMHLAGKDDVALYDGSWAEWGSDPETPKQTGPAA